jgi:hypothetical protein
LEQNNPTRQQGVSAALAAAQAQSAATPPVRFPGEDGGRSLAEMAQRDLDAALQLLADRAQYITGASGAAIALRRDGRNDMLCRASAGTNAPELGALLSTEFGLSGESVRTRQLMRCDDAERDARVNREVCRQLGIASVLVMPVVHDDHVLGVFELFSGKANAFGERDLSAVQRLSEMVETAVRMAVATDNLPEQLSARESSVAEAMHPEVFEGQFLSDLVVEEDKGPAPQTMAAALESSVDKVTSPTRDVSQKANLPEAQLPVAGQPLQAAPVPVAGPIPVLKPLFWSVAAAAEGESLKAGEADQSHVPPVLRGLSKCEACGFPISAGRELCVECEEKKWRGQLRPQPAARKPPSAVAAPKPAGPSFGAAPSMAKMPEVPAHILPEAEPKLAVALPSKPEESSRPMPEATQVRDAAPEASQSPEFVLSAGIEPQRSWFSANKYILIVLLVIAGAAVFFLLR